MTSATDELRKLLEERGVKWEGTPGITFWGNCSALDITTNEKEKVHLHLCCTPQQAIAATLGRGTCKPTEEDCCPICGEDLVKCNVGIGALGGAVELDPPIYHNYCPNCGAKVVDR